MDANLIPRILRTKTDEAVDDPDWAGTNTAPTEPVGGASICFGVPSYRGGQVGALRSVWVMVVCRTAAGALLNRGSCTFDMTPTECFSRDGETKGRGVAAVAAPAVVDQAPMVACIPNRWYEIPIHPVAGGGTNAPGTRGVTVRLSTIANLPGTTADLEVWIAPGG